MEKVEARVEEEGGGRNSGSWMMMMLEVEEGSDRQEVEGERISGIRA